MKMLVTRPEPDAEATIERLSALGIEAIAAPLLTRAPIAFNLPNISGFAAMAVTSANALRALEDRSAFDELRHLPVYAVGDRTALEARRLGFAEVYSAEGTLQSLSTMLALAQIKGPLFYPAGKHLSGNLAEILAPHGVMVVTTTVYDMVAEGEISEAALAALSGGQIGAVLLYSRRTAEVFAKLLGDRLETGIKRGLAALCMSENVARPMIEQHFTRVHLADRPDEEAMMALALAFARDQSGP
jgi:uroporphyrinogen-III synthase